MPLYANTGRETVENLRALKKTEKFEFRAKKLFQILVLRDPDFRDQHPKEYQRPCFQQNPRFYVRGVFEPIANRVI